MSFSSRGMTLVEVLVATSILSLITLASAASFAMFSQTYEIVRSQGSETAQLREVERFIRQSLTDAMSDGDFFRGEEDRIEWIAPLDRIGGAGGLQAMRIEHTGDALVLSLAPWNKSVGAEQTVWGEEIENFTLLTEVEAATFRYQKSTSDGWLAVWDDTEAGGQSTLPLTVAIGLSHRGRPLPPIIIALDQADPARRRDL